MDPAHQCLKLTFGGIPMFSTHGRPKSLLQRFVQNLLELLHAVGPRKIAATDFVRLLTLHRNLQLVAAAVWLVLSS